VLLLLFLPNAGFCIILNEGSSLVIVVVGTAAATALAAACSAATLKQVPVVYSLSDSCLGFQRQRGEH
jgi:hypothetical protein